MPTGLQVFDATGTIMLDATTRTGVILGDLASTGKSNGSLSVPGFALGQGFYICNPAPGWYWSSEQADSRAPTITISGTTLSWTFTKNGDAFNIPFRIFYGVR